MFSKALNPFFGIVTNSFYFFLKRNSINRLCFWHFARVDGQFNDASTFRIGSDEKMGPQSTFLLPSFFDSKEKGGWRYPGSLQK